jgi:glycosyltransferase involved in cell wall biosynthesis
VICTRNRCALLSGALASLRSVDVPPDTSWEIIVVDNGSGDDTGAVVAGHAGAIPVRLVVEPRVGLSYARNAAVREARGDYIIWIDDDVVVEGGWLAAYHRAFRRWPGAVFFGGAITPRFEGGPPAWLAAAMPWVGNAYAALDLGPDARRFTGEVLPYGANLAIRLADQQQHPYDVRLGRRGNLLYAGEEWAVIRRLLDQGAEGWWVPDARLEHVIEPHRQTIAYLRRYFRENGASYALVREPNGERMLLGRPRWLWREALSQELAYRVRRLYAPSSRWGEHLRRASGAWGMLSVAPPRR